MVKKKSKKGNKNISTLSKVLHSNIFRIALILTIIIAASFAFDKWIIKLVEIVSNDTLFNIFYAFTLLGEWYVLIWIAIFIALALFVNNKPVIPLVITLATTAISNVLIKLIISRPRPFETLGTGSIVATNLSSFPSGHAMAIFCIVPIVSKHFPRIKILFWVVAILVSLSRIYLGVHYLSDIVAGAIFGYAIGWLYLKLSENFGWKY